MLADKGYIALMGTLGNTVWSVFIFYPPLILLSLFAFLFVSAYVGLFHRQVDKVELSHFKITQKENSDTIFRGQTLEVTTDIEYSGDDTFAAKIVQPFSESFRLVNGNVEEPSLIFPGWKSNFYYSLVALESGEFEFKPMIIRLGDTMDLCKHEIETRRNLKVTVLPSPNERVQLLQSNIIMNAKSFFNVPKRADPQGDEFREIRQYVPGDSQRRIVWRAVAKDPEGELYVKDLEHILFHDVVCIVDAGEPMYLGPRGKRCIDFALDSVAALSSLVLESGHRFSLKVWNSTDEQFLLHGYGQTQMGRILYALSLVKPNYQLVNLQKVLEKVYPKLKGGSLILVVSRLTTETLGSLDSSIAEAEARGHKIRFVVPAAWEFFQPSDITWSQTIQSYIVSEERRRLQSLERETIGGWKNFSFVGPEGFLQSLLKAYLIASKESVKK